jgi:hypothetical protein
MRTPLAIIISGVFAAEAILAFATGTTHAEPSQYLCVVEHAVGLHYDKQVRAWGPQSFQSGGKYIFRKLNDDDRGRWRLREDYPEANWAFFEFGKPMPLMLRKGGVCRRIVLDGSFDFDSGRFEIVARGGYLHQGFLEQFRRENPNHEPLHDLSNPDDHKRVPRRSMIGSPEAPRACACAREGRSPDKACRSRCGRGPSDGNVASSFHAFRVTVY